MISRGGLGRGEAWFPSGEPEDGAAALDELRDEVRVRGEQLDAALVAIAQTAWLLHVQQGVASRLADRCGRLEGHLEATRGALEAELRRLGGG